MIEVNMAQNRNDERRKLGVDPDRLEAERLLREIIVPVWIGLYGGTPGPEVMQKVDDDIEMLVWHLIEAAGKAGRGVVR